MKRSRIVWITVACMFFALVAWVTTVTAKSDTQKQKALIDQAEIYINDEAYVRAEPLLDEAASYSGKYAKAAEEGLKTVYLKLLDSDGYRRKYTNLLDAQMGRKGAEPAVFREAAEYYMSAAKETKALAVLRDGIAKTGDEALRQYYEEHRYVYKMSCNVYQDVTAPCNGGVQVKLDGKWGLAATDGTLVIPCVYDKISTFSGVSVVKQGAEVFAVNSSNLRYALSHESISDFGELNDDRIGVKTENGWVLATADFTCGSLTVDGIGMYSGGVIPAKSGGKWGFMDSNGAEWSTAPQFDDIIRDEVGRCCAQDAVFVRVDDGVRLYVDGKMLDGSYEDAKPFADDWAAVKQHGKWGFINTAGEIMIDFQYDNALSFGQHLAAVQQGRDWGYISLQGKMVIAPNFLDARSFSNGSAAVKTADGWRFITLLEYKEEAGL